MAQRLHFILWRTKLSLYASSVGGWLQPLLLVRQDISSMISAQEAVKKSLDSASGTKCKCRETGLTSTILPPQEASNLNRRGAASREQCGAAICNICAVWASVCIMPTPLSAG